MPGGSRSLPGRPNLRHLKLEAKRRLAAGEFPTLHDAQLAIAREYGQPSWAALKQAIGEAAEASRGNRGDRGEPRRAEPGSHALDQLRWLRDRFSGAGQPGWTAPAEDELREHFSEQFLAAIPPARLVQAVSQMAADLRGEFEVISRSRCRPRSGWVTWSTWWRSRPSRRTAWPACAPCRSAARSAIPG